MPIIDNRTPYLDLPLPNSDNNLSDDVGRLIEALGDIDTKAQAVDTAVGAKLTPTASLNAIGALTPAADRLPYFTGTNTGALAVLSSWIRTNFLPASTASAARTALELATVANSGSYNDLSDKPTIPSPPTSTDALTEGSSNLYHTEARVRSSLLTGLSTAVNAAVSATDSILAAIGKLQAQISANTGSGNFNLTNLGEKATAGSETVNIDCAAGDYFIVSMDTANTTGTLTLNLQNVPQIAGKGFTGHIELVRGGRKTVAITVPGGMTFTWIQGVAPTFQTVAGKYDTIMFYVRNGRPRINAMIVDTGDV